MWQSFLPIGGLPFGGKNQWMGAWWHMECVWKCSGSGGMCLKSEKFQASFLYAMRVEGYFGFWWRWWFRTSSLVKQSVLLSVSLFRRMSVTLAFMQVVQRHPDLNLSSPCRMVFQL